MRITDLSISEETDAHIWDRHGIDSRVLRQILQGEHKIRRNRRNRTATHTLIGHDLSGHCYEVQIRPTDKPSTWKVITA